MEPHEFYSALKNLDIPLIKSGLDSCTHINKITEQITEYIVDNNNIELAKIIFKSDKIDFTQGQGSVYLKHCIIYYRNEIFDLYLSYLERHQKELTSSTISYLYLFFLDTISYYQNKEIFERFLKSSLINPAENANSAMAMAYAHENKEFMQLLWEDERVKNTLKEDQNFIYNQIMKKVITEKVELF